MSLLKPCESKPAFKVGQLLNHLGYKNIYKIRYKWYHYLVPRHGWKYILVSIRTNHTCTKALDEDHIKANFELVEADPLLEALYGKR